MHQAKADLNIIKPSKFTLFMRTFFVWQFYRFVMINIRMTFMILKSHGQKIKSDKRK